MEGSTLILMAVSDLPGERILKVALDQVKVMRLNGPVASRYSEGHYLCTLEVSGGESHHLRAEVGNQEAVQDYGRLITAIHLHVTRMASPPKFRTGLKSALGFYLFAGFMLLSMGVLAVASVFGMMRKHNYLTGIALVSAMGIITFYMLKFAAKTLLPRAYDPHAPGDLLLPIFTTE